jgi:outer membrane receptor protein involved in Fe transport
MKKHSRFALALLASGGATAMATFADAQQTAASQEEVVVTGSRVIKNGNQSPTPLTVVATDQLLAVSPGTIADALNTLPQFGGSQTSTSGPGSGVRNGAAAFVELRNVGDNHTLVLYDGHRLLPATPQASAASDVDLNLIPQYLLKRVDIVTGGAGAVYGSDAISGVVNLITDTNFNGVKAYIQGGVSARDDSPSREGAIAFGRRVLNDRGHVEVSYEHRKDQGILNPANKADRPFFGGIYGGSGAGTAASPYMSLANARLASSSFGGKIISATGAIAALNNLNFSQDNTLSTFNVATDGAYFRNSSIKASLNLSKVFGRFDYDLTNNVKAYVQYGHSRETTANYFQNPILSYNVGLNNPYLDTVTSNAAGLSTAQFQALRAANPAATFRMSTWLVDQELNAGPIKTTVGYNMLFGGLDGDLGDYHWTVRGGHSQADQAIVNYSNIDVGRFFAAVDTTRNASGQIVCRTTNPTYAGCVPLNPFGPSAANVAAYDWVTRPSIGRTNVTLDEIQGSFEGAPFSTWAGPVDIALSGEWHKTNYTLTSETTTFDIPDCSGLRFGTTTGTSVTGNCNGAGTTNPTARWSGNVLNNLPHAEIEVFEGAVEGQVPLVRDVAFAKAVDLNMAARFTDYSTSGSAWTWKVGGVWQVNDNFRLRATRSRDIRAPNLFELFAPQQVSVQTFQDFVVNGVGTTQSGTVGLVSTGDPSIQPETADTSTAGFIWEPSFIPGFSVSVDAWRLQLENTIFQVRAIDQFVRDACIQSGGTSDYCAFYVRPTPTSFPTKLVAKNRNIASQDTYGADFESAYSTKVMDRPVDFRLLLTYQPHNIYNTGTGTILDIGGAYGNLPANVAPSPAMRGTFIANVNLTDSLRVSVLEKWRSGMDSTSGVKPGTQAIFNPDRIGGIAYTNLTVTYKAQARGANFEIYGNVQNLFDTFPDPAPQVPDTRPGRGIQPMAIGDDPIGRYFVLGLRMKL